MTARAAWRGEMERARARIDLRSRQNARHGFEGLHGAKRVARGDYVGGYLHIVVTMDGGLLCPACVRANWYDIVHSTRGGYRDGWAVSFVTYSGALEGHHPCDHCGTELAAYPGPDDEE